MVPYIIQGNNIVVFSGGVPTTVDSTHINYAKLLEALKTEDWDAIPGLLTVKKAIESFSEGRAKFENDTVYFDGVPLQNALSDRIVRLFRDGFPITHFLKFIERLNANPSYRAVNELYGFLEANSLPITDDGCFLAYKRIREDWTDCYTGTMDNSIGTVVEMPRNQVNDDKDQTCSRGLHFCGYSYLSSFSGARLVVVKVDPADVVSIPSDYNNQKGRACKYTIVEEIADNRGAEKTDPLGSGPSVRTGWSDFETIEDWTPVSDSTQFTRKKSVENVLNTLTEDELYQLRVHINNSTSYAFIPEFREEVDNVVARFTKYVTFRTIRDAMKELGYM